MKKINPVYVLDTNVYLTDFRALYQYGKSDIIIPLKVLEEIDKHKSRQDGVGSNARQLIRELDSLRAKGNLANGVSLGDHLGRVFSKSFNPGDIPPGYDPTAPDNEIIGTVITASKIDNRGKYVIVTKDINMRVKCDALGLDTEDYNVNQIVSSHSELYSGHTAVEIDDGILDEFYRDGNCLTDHKHNPNEYVTLQSKSATGKTALAKFRNGEYQSLYAPAKGLWGIKPRNREQQFAIDMLMDSSIKVVSLIGQAGAGKTLLATAAGLEQVVEQSTYKRLIVSRPIQPMGKDLGYLPGNIQEKMSPWLAPIQDNLRTLMGNDSVTLKMYMDQGTIEMEALTYIRGRSITDSFIIIDEAQNLSAHELKTIITRIGEGTKIVLTGDIQQIDNVYINDVTNGLSVAAEKFKAHDISGHITLQKGERSAVATLAAEIL